MSSISSARKVKVLVSSYWTETDCLALYYKRPSLLGVKEAVTFSTMIRA